MNVSAIIVTRGDVDLEPVLASLPDEWDKHAWINGRGLLTYYAEGLELQEHFDTDLSVYGRYEAIERARHEIVYVQDDDCIVSDPEAIVGAINLNGDLSKRNFVVCNMPEPWRSNPFYQHHALVGFGGAFHRDVPAQAFDRLAKWWSYRADPWPEHLFNDTCDVVATGLNHRVLVDVPHVSLPYAYHDSRMWKQDDHQARRQQMLDYVRAAA